MIHAYTGTPGSGKSYNLTAEGIAALAKGRTVWANYGFQPEYVYLALRSLYRVPHREAVAATGRIHELRTYEDLVGLYDAVLLFDEAHDWLNSRSYNAIPREIVSWWSQHRHAGVEVHLATQRLGSVDAHVRSLVGHVWLCRPAPLLMALPMRLVGNRSPLLRLTEIFDEAEAGGRRGKSAFESMAANRLVPLKPKIARCYDTRGGVFPSPLYVLERQKSPLAMDLHFRFKDFRKRSVPGPVDGLPALGWHEYRDLVAAGERPHVELARRFDALTPPSLPTVN